MKQERPAITGLRAALIAALLAAAVALPSIRNDLAQDDRWIVTGRPVLQHPASLRALLTEPYWPRSFHGGLWRPAVLASYALDYRFSSSPHWFHAVNVAWAALAAFVLTLLAIAVAGPGVGLAAGALFAVHPVHVEAAAGVVGRAELMAAAAAGAALLCVLRARDDRRWLAGIVIATAVAVGAKEQGALLPLAVLLVLAARGDRWRDMVLPTAAALIPVLLYVTARSVVAGGVLAAGGLAPGLEGLTLAQRAWAMLALSLEWWRLALLPLHLSAEYSPGDVTVSTGLSPRHLVALTLWLGTAWTAWRCRRSAPAVTLGIAWAVLTLLPVANLVPTEILVAERTLFLPSWGAMVALAGAGALLPWPRRAKNAAVAVLVILGAARSIPRAGVWRNDETWYAALQRDAPRSYRTLWMQGNDAFRAGQWGTGERLLREAMAVAPGIPGPLEDLAGFYGRAGLWAQAAGMYRRAMELNETRPKPWTLLPSALLAARDTAGAVEWAEQAATRFPTDASVAGASLDALLSAGRCDRAAALLDARVAQLPAVFVEGVRVRLGSCAESSRR